MSVTYFKIVSIENEEKELMDDLGNWKYAYSKGTRIKDKSHAFQLAKQHIGKVVEVEEKIIGGWRFIDENGNISDGAY
jgi:hypothetical protein